MNPNSPRTYPYQAWTLSPSYKPVQVTLVKRAYAYSTSLWDWDESDSGKPHHIRHLFPTVAEVLAFASKEIDRIQADLNKRVENLNKKRATLQKAAELYLA